MAENKKVSGTLVRWKPRGASAKAHDLNRNSLGALKRSFTRINAVAATEGYRNILTDIDIE
jgi:hypothetical protein